jgi:choline dehydrogenase-like flavoprotein
MATVPFVGPRLIELAERFDRVAMFGFMIEDTSRGRVRSVRGQPLISYVLNDHDVARLKRGVEILARVFLAAGATSVLPLVHGFDELRSERDLGRLRRAKLRARDFEPSAYHPLGTARMGVDPRRSVVGPDFQAHDVPGLFITDGAVMPSSLAVNPQLTIMAMATRAAESIAEALS